MDAGTMSPFEHGEVFVLDDGGEVNNSTHWRAYAGFGSGPEIPWVTHQMIMVDVGQAHHIGHGLIKHAH